MSGELNPTTWADGYGVWHASVPITTPMRQAHAARRAILAELEARDDLRSGYRLRVTREHVTNHGTVHYVERTDQR